MKAIRIHEFGGPEVMKLEDMKCSAPQADEILVLTDLISERIIIEAKRELYLTNKAIKGIAYELGYEDEHYFSRFIKTNADISPQMYRDRVGLEEVLLLKPR